MKRLLDLLKDGHSRPVDEIAAELETSVGDVRRKIEFLEKSGVIRRVVSSAGNCTGTCSSCGGCSANAGSRKSTACSGCMPEGGFKNMGTVWEVVG
ncbi:MAG: Lrp/AsnC family transcriptional regulator [Treponema sp.]|nr:Lrp/AsnC family transcriptional regulator [Treponema sp.]